MVQLISTFLVVLMVGYGGGQRVAPGVPPQHYEANNQAHQGYQPPPPPAHQHQQYQQQQVPQHQAPVQQQYGQQQVPIQPNQVPQQQQQQQQQVPVQQQQHQVPVQQQQQVAQPQHGSPGHGHAHGQARPGQLLDASNVGEDRQHIQEHMAVPIDTSQMSEQELQFHYFKMHDADGNNKLDGCELVKSLIHWHDQSNHDPKAGQPIPEAKIFQDEELINMIDPILLNDDKNSDGYIDYAEFVQAQASVAAKQPPSQPQQQQPH